MQVLEELFSFIYNYHPMLIKSKKKTTINKHTAPETRVSRKYVRKIFMTMLASYAGNSFLRNSLYSRCRFKLLLLKKIHEDPTKYSGTNQ